MTAFFVHFAPNETAPFLISRNFFEINGDADLLEYCIINNTHTLNSLVAGYIGDTMLPVQKFRFQNVGGQKLVDTIIEQAGGQISIDSKAQDTVLKSIVTSMNLKAISEGGNVQSSGAEISVNERVLFKSEWSWLDG